MVRSRGRTLIELFQTRQYGQPLRNYFCSHFFFLRFSNWLFFSSQEGALFRIIYVWSIVLITFRLQILLSRIRFSCFVKINSIYRNYRLEFSWTYQIKHLIHWCLPPLWNVAQKWAVHETMKYNHFFFSNISFEIWEWWLGEICFRSNRAIFLSSNLRVTNLHPNVPIKNIKVIMIKRCENGSNTKLDHIKLIDDENLTNMLILIFRDLKFNPKRNSTSLI